MNDQASGQNPAQGWYTDPHDASKLRWWDGTGWTDHTHPPADEAAAQPAAEPATAAQPAAAAQPTAAAQPAAAAGQPAAQPQSSPPGAGGIVSNPAPKADGSAGGGEKGAVAQWFSVRSNQVLFLVLLVAIVLFIFVMAGGAS